MIVEIPPKLEARAIDNMMPNEKLRTSLVSGWFSFITCMTDKAIGNIIIVVAVLLSHILIKPVARINPNMILLPLVPVRRTILSAILLCRFHFSIARPNRKPPRKRKITGLAKDEAVASSGAILNKGKSTNGNKATTGIGRDSVTHKVIMSTAIAITLFPARGTSNGLIRKTITASRTLIITSTILLDMIACKQKVLPKIQ